MRATLTREGRDVGVFVMDRDGHYTWDCFDEDQERFDEVKGIIEGLSEPYAAVGRGGPHAVTYKPGDSRWFDRVLAKLQNKGYEHVVIKDVP